MKELLLKTFTNQKGTFNIKLLVCLFVFAILVMFDITFAILTIKLLLNESGAAMGSLAVILGCTIAGGILIDEWENITK